MEHPFHNPTLIYVNNDNDSSLIPTCQGECCRNGISQLGGGVLLLLCLFCIAGTANAQVNSADYYSLAPGARSMWSVTEDGEVTDVVSKVADTPTLINGVQTLVLEFSDGTKLYLGADQEGFKVHRLIQPSSAEVQPGVFVDVTVTLDPAAPIIGTVVDAGDTFPGSGTATVELAGVGSGTVPYTSQSTFIGIGSVTVPAGTFADTMQVDSSLSLSGTLLGQPFAQQLGFEQWAARSASFVKFIEDADGTISTNELITSSSIAQPVALASSILPTSRSVQTGMAATIFSTIINAGSVTASQCRIAAVPALPAEFSYQTTDPATNAVTGTPDTPVDIAANGGFQTFVVSLTPAAAIDPTDVEFAFACTNSSIAPSIPGVNTMLLAASDTPVPDIVALAATPSADGIVKIPGSFGSNAFAVATVNVGSQDVITAEPDTGSAKLPLNLFICETDPLTGACLSTPAASVTTTISAGATPTFAIFVNGLDFVSFDPANNRIYVRFKDTLDVTRGSTSVAVETL